MTNKLHRATCFATITTAALLGAAFANPALAGGHDQPDHIFLIMMENHATNQIIGNTADAPFVNDIAHRYGVALNYYGVTHPSLPNYLAIISGDFQGVYDDCKAGAAETCAPEEFVPGAGDATDPTFSGYSDPKSPLFGKVPPQLSKSQVAAASSKAHWFSGKTIVDQLESAGMTWKAYMQSLPISGSTTGADTEYWPVIGGNTYKMYAQKHDPFMYFSNIRSDPARMANIVPLPQLDSDLANNTPNFLFIVPDQCNDMHDVSNGVPLGYPGCTSPASGLDDAAIKLGDTFLQNTVNKIMNSSAWSKNSIIAIAWDEDDYNSYPTGCCGSPVAGVPGSNGSILGGSKTPAIVIHSSEPAHRESTHPYNHYSLLGTIERVWNLGCLANTCSFTDGDLMLDLFGN